MISGTVRVRCPACRRSHEVKLVQSIDTRVDLDARERLLAGTLNTLDCECGKRTMLAAKLVYYDTRDAERAAVFQVAPDEAAVHDARVAFAASGISGQLRIVPSQNALVEKVKIFEAGLEDWAIEMTKVLLLASETDQLNTVLLFEAIDREAGRIHWVRHDEDGVRRVASALAAYEKLAATEASRPAASELQIDRAWAVAAVQAMIARAN
jgi:hypothetical protein